MVSFLCHSLLKKKKAKRKENNLFNLYSSTEVKYVSFYCFFQTLDLITFLHFGHEPDGLSGYC